MTELTALSPGTVAAVLIRQGGSATVVASAGFATEVGGIELPDAALAALVAPHASGTGAHPAPLSEHAPEVRYWRGAPLISKGTDRFLLIGGTTRVTDGLFDAFLTLSHQVALAEASCLSRVELHHQAHHDHLTALPTRALFFRRVAQAVDVGADKVALLNIDLDDFKKVNDVHGHSAGDELLVQIAARLREAGGPGSVPARFGGDEFALLLTDLTDPAEAVQIAERVCQRIIEPVHLSAAIVSVGASVGVAVADTGLTAGDLVRCADVAMYSAKARGKNRVALFTPQHQGEAAHHRMLEEHPGQATDRGEIVVGYPHSTGRRNTAGVNGDYAVPRSV